MTTQPSCYGKSWDPNSVECKGGLDPAYTNPEDQTHRRDRCSWFQPCSQIVTQSAPSTPQLIPPRALLLQHRAVDTPPPRPVAPPIYSPPRPPTYQQPQTQYSLPPAPAQVVPTPPSHPQFQPQPQLQHGSAPHVMYQQQPVMMAPPSVAQYGQQFVPMPYQNPGSQVPQYLTMPEPVYDGERWGGFLRTMARTGLKAIGLGIAAYVDSYPFRRHDR